MPSWSPNGGHIAFIRILGPEGSSVTDPVFIARADGSHPRQVTHPSTRYEDFNPIYAPGGQRLVFFRFDEKRDQDAVFTIHTDGTHEERITPWRRSCAAGVDWSPNGRWIIVTCTWNDQREVTLVHPSGTGLHALTHSGSNVQWLSSSFSPNGLKIVSSRRPADEDGNADIYVMRLDGSGLRRITQSRKYDSAPDWGPRR